MCPARDVGPLLVLPVDSNDEVVLHDWDYQISFSKLEHL